MSGYTDRFINHEDGDRIASALELIAIAKAGEITTFESHKAIQQIVRAGLAPKYFNIGDQLIEKWNDGNNHEYDLPFDVVDFRNVKRIDGKTVPGMVLQAHYVTPGVQFDGNEAFYVSDEVLPTGTYYVTMGQNWGTHVISGKSYYFTLANDVPAGGQLVFERESSTTAGLPDIDYTGWRVRVYASPTTMEATETVTVQEGTQGTSLGTLIDSTKYSETGINNLHRAAYGYDRWAQSGVRQYLNSDLPVLLWWAPQNPYDRAPDQLKTMRGFMAGFESDFLSALQPVEVVTALNAKSDIDIGTTEATYDTFFLPSLQEEYILPQLADVEGAAWEYWRERLGGSAPQGYYTDNLNAAHIRYAVENHTAAQYVRLRSAYRSYAHLTWYVTTAGYVYNYAAAHANRLAPACVIC